MENEKTSLFPLPDTQVVETVYVRLADGRLVARSAEEVALLSQDEMPAVIIPSLT
jgi:hypothetical protein